MSNKALSILLILSFAVIFLGLSFGDFFYSVGALGTLILGGLVLSRLYRYDRSDWFPYVAGVVMLVFWSFAIIAPEGLEVFAPFYLVSGIWSSLKLYRKE